jgi:hypothetical protein
METFGEFASLRQVLRNLALYWDKRSPGWLEISMQEGNGSIFHNIWSSIHAIKIPSFGTSLHELWYQFCYINAFYPWLSLSFFLCVATFTLHSANTCFEIQCCQRFGNWLIETLSAHQSNYWTLCLPASSCLLYCANLVWKETFMCL